MGDLAKSRTRNTHTVIHFQDYYHDFEVNSVYVFYISEQSSMIFL